MFITGPRSGHQRWCNIATGYMHICKFVVRYIVTGCIFCAPSALRQVRFSTPSGTPPPSTWKSSAPPPPGLVTGNQIRNVRKNTLCKCKQHYCVVTLQFWKKKKKKKKHLVSLTFMYKSDHGALLWKFATFYFDIQHNLIVLRTFHAKQSWQIMYQWKIK